ncbi:hypothetical protein D3C71_1741460 [compost metagenome]
MHWRTVHFERSLRRHGNIHATLIGNPDILRIDQGDIVGEVIGHDDGKFEEGAALHRNAGKFALAQRIQHHHQAKRIGRGHDPHTGLQSIVRRNEGADQ